MEHSEFFQRIRMPGNPQAHPDAVVVRGHARFTVLTERLLRLEWSPTGEFTDFATFAFPNRRLDPPPAFVVDEDGTRLRIRTAWLTLNYQLGSGAFTRENLEITIRLGEQTRSWRPGQRDETNLLGTRRTLDLTGGDAPLALGLVSRDGWSIYDDSAGVVLVPDGGWVAARPRQSEQDWYFFGYGHAYADAMAEYTLFGGAVPLIPRYVLGIWWSRFWRYHADELEKLVDDFAEHALPLDVLVIDMDWHTPGRWTGYTWNRELFPDPAAFLERLHQRGLHVTLNLHPADGVDPQEAAYADMAAALGMPETDRSPIPFRITDRRFTQLYFMSLHHPLEEQGIDFWWVDWQQGEKTEIEGLDPLIWLNHLHFADIARSGKRPLIFSRWGGLGNHRYPIGFSGDTFGGWATLAALPRFTATSANVGFGWWSHDIGGHFGQVSGELLTRWIQFGVLSPCLRLHAAKHPLWERQPWAFPEALDAIRQAFELRYRLAPYLYTMARHTHERGIALCRPMYYAYPEHESAYHAHGQYQLGDDLVAAPITEPADPVTGVATKDVWIPPGTWYRFDNGNEFVGPRWTRLSCDLETILLFARAGAVVPLARPALHLADMPKDWLDILVFPGADGSFRHYDDDGVSLDYLHGDFEWTALKYAHPTAQSGLFRIDPVVGECAALPRSRGYQLTFLGVGLPEWVGDENDEPLPWSYDQDARRVQVTLSPDTKLAPRSVALRWPDSATTDEALAAGEDEVLPFAHVITYTVTQEAERQLAEVILVPPDRGPCDVEIRWRDDSRDAVSELLQVVTNLQAEEIVTAPFTLDSTLQPHHLEIEVRFATPDRRVTAVCPGVYINPPVQLWNLRYAGQVEWRVVQADTTARPSIAEPFEVPLDPALAREADAFITMEFAESLLVWFDSWTSGTLSLDVDETTLESALPQPTLAGLTHPWQVMRYGPVHLTAGTHRLRVRLTAPEAPAWVFGVLLVDDSGRPLWQCAYTP